MVRKFRYNGRDEKTTWKRSENENLLINSYIRARSTKINFLLRKCVIFVKGGDILQLKFTEAVYPLVWKSNSLSVSSKLYYVLLTSVVFL